MGRTWLKRLREEKGLTQKQTAEKCGIKLNQYARLETIGGMSSPEACQKVADFFGFNVQRIAETAEHDRNNPFLEGTGRIRVTVPASKQVYNTGLYEDEMKILARIHHNGPLKGFHPMLTVTADGQITGDYWDGLARAEIRR